jgi:hypothetical protein
MHELPKTYYRLASGGSLTWMPAYDEQQMREFAYAAIAAEREACAKLCEQHAKNQLIVRVTNITDDQFSVYALDCATLIRMRGNNV